MALIISSGENNGWCLLMCVGLNHEFMGFTNSESTSKTACVCLRPVTMQTNVALFAGF